MLSGELDDISFQIGKLKGAIVGLGDKIDGVDKRIADQEEDIDEIKSTVQGLAANNKNTKRRLVALEAGEATGNWLSVVKDNKIGLVIILVLAVIIAALLGVNTQWILSLL